MTTDLPRPLPLKARRQFVSGLGLSIGFALCALSLLFLFIYQWHSHAARQFRDDDPRVSGVVTDVQRPTNTRGTPSSDTKTYRFSYEVDGKIYEARHDSTDYLKTDNVTVQYVPEDPQLARIEGLDRLGSWIFLIFVVGAGLPGLLFIYYCVSEARRKIRQVKYGVITSATVVRNDLPGGGFTRELQFVAQDGRAYGIAPGLHMGILQEGARMDVFYERDQPANATLLDKVEPKVRACL
ncbi:MAG: DUF3592 domain-containing protein [Telluria sp.]